MQEKVDLVKEVYGRNTYVKVVNTKFSELYTPVTASQGPTTITVAQFFDYYNQLFFEIPATGELNTHEYLVKRSTEYLGGPVLSDNELAYIQEINALRQQLLEQSQNFLDLNKIV